MSSFLSDVRHRLETAYTATMKHITDMSLTMRAGAYEPLKPGQLHRDFMASASLPEKIGIKVSRNALSLAATAIGDVIITTLQMISFSALTIGGIVAGALGLGALGYIYKSSKTSAAQVISEENAAGQTVSGTRSDLYVMHQAQKKIISLSRSFEEVASQRQIRAEINDVIEKTNSVRARIKVLNSGDAPGHRDEYDLVIPPEEQYRDALPSCGGTVMS